MRRTLLGTCTGVLAFVLIAEALCWVLPVSTASRGNYYIDPHIHTYEPHLKFRSSFGWDLRNPQWLQANGSGFISDHQFTRDPKAVALIGDSLVEGASLHAQDRLGAQLESLLQSKRTVYAMSSPGTALLDYAERIRYASQQFGIHDFVLLMESSDVQQSLCGSGNVKSQCLDPVSLEPRTVPLAPASALKRVLRNSALAQYLVGQLKVEPARLLRSLVERRTPDEASTPDAAGSKTHAVDSARAPTSMREVDAVASTFFERVRPYATGRLIIVVDANRRALSRQQSAADPHRAHFIDLARRAGATVVDTEDMFRLHYQRSRLSLDVGPSDSHFNALGVKMIARSMADALSND